MFSLLLIPQFIHRIDTQSLFAFYILFFSIYYHFSPRPEWFLLLVYSISAPVKKMLFPIQLQNNSLRPCEIK